MPTVVLQVDGTPGDLATGTAGVGMVVRTLDGVVLRWNGARASAHTCNEAEYQAVIAGLRWANHHYPTAHIVCLTDSRVVVEQMCGRAAVRTKPLQPLYREAMALVRRCAKVTFHAIPREINRLADALAWEALSGRTQIEQVAMTSVNDGEKRRRV